MAAIPNLEGLLLSIHAILGCPAPRKKQELKDLRRPFDIHLRELGLLVEDILAEMGLDPGATFDALRNLEEFGHFHKTLEIKTWTFGAEFRQVIWDLLACVYVPGLARRVAFWNLEVPSDPDMPGGDFWYLPQVEPTGAAPRLRMPMGAVLDWLEDLLGQPVHKAIRTWPDPNVDAESVQRSLAKWRVGDVPRRENVERYFAEGTHLEFQGCLVLEERLSPDQALDGVRSFLKRKGLTADKLRLQIPITAPGHLEALLEGREAAEEVSRFLSLVKARYGQPSLRTIRRRLVVARATQHAYIKIHRLICPGISLLETDANLNKVMQLVGIYGGIYNLTVRACSISKDWGEQDAWFEQRLAPRDRRDLFLSILPSKRQEGALDLARLLSKRFAAAEPGAPLDDWAATDPRDLPALLERRNRQFAREANDLGDYEKLVEALRTIRPAAAVQATENYNAILLVATDPRVEAGLRSLAVQRMRALPATDAQQLDSILIELDLYLNDFLNPASEDVRQVVEGLLQEAKSNRASDRRKPQLLNAQAKHHLRSNEFSQARAAFRAALDASLADSCGDLPGLIARDVFAFDCAVKPSGFTVVNCERYWRVMLSFAVIHGPELSLEQAAQELESYFWDELYQPYPSLTRHLRKV
jgi:hypothetical protein